MSAQAGQVETGATALEAVAAFEPEAFLQDLVEAGELAEQDAALALEVARQSGVTPVRALLDLGAAGEEQVAAALARTLQAPLLELEPDAAALSDRLPLAYQRAAGVALLEEGDESLTLAVTDPSLKAQLRAAAQALGTTPVRLAIAKAGAVEALHEAQGHSGGQIEAHDEALASVSVESEVAQLRELASEAPVIRFFNQTIERALTLGASDVHLERYDRVCSLRMRVDGLLIEQPPPPESLFEALLCRVKILAGLDVAKRRIAQDGRIRMRLRGGVVDLRVSLVPTLYGQDAAIRIQDAKALERVELEELGFLPQQRRWLDRLCGAGHGMLLITGPTGSGKTTTLYALLKRLRSASRKIVTVEDPVEHAMDGVNQIQVNEAAGMGFANTLRHVLRHDPDVILVGEIRDAQTAQMAFQAALTGHLVLTTLHTNDAPGAAVRLVDMGVEPYLVAAATLGATAQRLLRRLCPTCRAGALAREACATCQGLGYRGRVAVMEQVEMTPALRTVVARQQDESALRAALEEQRYRAMRDVARGLVEEGVTDEAEVARVLGREAV